MSATRALFASIRDANQDRFKSDNFDDFWRSQVPFTNGFTISDLDISLKGMRLLSSVPQKSKRRLEFKRWVGKSDALVVFETFSLGKTNKKE